MIHHGSSIVLTSGANASDVLEIVAFGTFVLNNTSINDLTDVTTGGVADGQVLVYNTQTQDFSLAMLVQQKSMVLIYHLLHQQLIILLMFNRMVDQINILFLAIHKEL